MNPIGSGDAAAMGTANCMNPVNGKVVHEDYLSVRERIRVEAVHDASSMK